MPNARASYLVSACAGMASDSVNRSWTSTGTAPAGHVMSFSQCSGQAPDPYGDMVRGVGVVDTLGGGVNIPADARYLEQHFVAPSGTSISGIEVTRDIGNRDVYWQPYARIDSQRQAGEGCVKPAFEAFCRVTGARSFAGLAATSVAWGVECSSSYGSCTNGATLHHVWAIVRSATVTLEDFEAPVVGAPSGALADGGWKRGSGSLEFEASDNTGVRVRRLVEGGVVRATRTAPGAPVGCGDLNVGDAYTYVKPCDGSRGLSGVQTVSVADVCSWGDGVHAVRAQAVDTAGGVATSSGAATVRVDCGAPVVQVSSNRSGSVAPGEVVEPVVSAEDARAGVASVEVQVQTGPGEWRAYSGPVVAAVGEAYRFRARATDAIGNVSSWSAASAWATTASPTAVGTAQQPVGVTAAGAGAPGDDESAPTGVVSLPLNPVPTAGPKLSITRIKRQGRLLTVSGRLVSSTAGRVTASVVLRGRKQPVRRTLRVKNGVFAGRLRIGTSRRVRSVAVTARSADGRMVSARRSIPAR